MNFKWYIVYVVSGQEQKVCNEINRIADKKEGINKAFVPMKQVLKVKRGKKVEDLQKIFPGYVFAHIDLAFGVNDDIVYVLHADFCNDYTVTINSDNTVTSSGSIRD